MPSIVLQELSTVENCGKREREHLRTGSNARALFGAVSKERSVPLSIEMRACSACAGDYEDPDRTAWPTDEEKSDAGQTEDEDRSPEGAS
jgi:hypothetical protein